MLDPNISYVLAQLATLLTLLSGAWRARKPQASAIAPGLFNGARAPAFFSLPHMREGSGAPKGATVFIRHLFEVPRAV